MDLIAFPQQRVVVHVWMRIVEQRASRRNVAAAACRRSLVRFDYARVRLTPASARYDTVDLPFGRAGTEARRMGNLPNVDRYSAKPSVK